MGVRGIGVVTAIACMGAAVRSGHGWAALVVAIYGIHNGQVFKRHYDSYRDAHTHTRWQRLSARERASQRY